MCSHRNINPSSGQCMPHECRVMSLVTSVLIAQAIFLLEHGQTDSQTNPQMQFKAVLTLAATARVGN